MIRTENIIALTVSIPLFLALVVFALLTTTGWDLATLLFIICCGASLVAFAVWQNNHPY